MGGLYKKPFDRPQSYTVFGRIPCNERSGGARSTIASKVEKMGGLYKKPFDRPQSYTVFGRIPCNGRSGGARSTIASKVEKMGGLYKKPFDRPQSYTVFWLDSVEYAMMLGIWRSRSNGAENL
jgi:hypothetical protein